VGLDERADADQQVLERGGVGLRRAAVAVESSGKVIIAVAGLTISLLALNRNIETVAEAAPKDNSVVPAALETAAVTAIKIAPGAVSTGAVADDGIRRADIAPDAIGGTQIAAGSVTGGDVKHDTLTGTQIDERTLRDVASAQNCRARRDGTRRPAMPRAPPSPSLAACPSNSMGRSPRWRGLPLAETGPVPVRLRGFPQPMARPVRMASARRGPSVHSHDDPTAPRRDRRRRCRRHRGAPHAARPGR
jgi:hypothetical protein